MVTTPPLITNTPTFLAFSLSYLSLSLSLSFFPSTHKHTHTHTHTCAHPDQKLEAQVPYSGAVGLSPAQFYVRRDHTLGGSVSRLDRLRTHQELPYMESFPEVEEEEENGEPDKQEQISGEWYMSPSLVPRLPDISMCKIEKLGMGGWGQARLVLVYLCLWLCLCTSFKCARYSFRRNSLASCTNLPLNFFMSRLQFQTLGFCMQQASKQSALFIVLIVLHC